MPPCYEPPPTSRRTPVVREAWRVPRIVAGWAGSLQLAVPPDGTRPTSDRTREALFSMLEARDAIAGAAVLDLYAGSGAFGLEALSRGAASVVLVEKAPKAARVIRENVGRLRRAADGPLDAAVVQQAVRTFLATAAPGVGLAFLDPPYDLADEDVAADLVVLAPLLEPDALVLVERSSRSPAPVLPPTLVLERTRTYGDTAVHVLTTA
ncbi:16S rRNA (guanine(966)-N(2))-methyltransferase RsmD [Amnibacterium kyonggiense]|uniref:16S rRNA (guanine(966)-N(2))-methyltransferase RsmD n=1 Tax=Amnibacterium kyonggiense TaxID=595671 RepID=UPI00105B4B52|nr:16S rRNA (guanine(966)-N(2))-methyltransferase RsmD [Amnibacterium kyonggiense]